VARVGLCVSLRPRIHFLYRGFISYDSIVCGTGPRRQHTRPWDAHHLPDGRAPVPHMVQAPSIGCPRRSRQPLMTCCTRRGRWFRRAPEKASPPDYRLRPRLPEGRLPTLEIADAQLPCFLMHVMMKPYLSILGSIKSDEVMRILNLWCKRPSVGMSGIPRGVHPPGVNRVVGGWRRVWRNVGGEASEEMEMGGGGRAEIGGRPLPNVAQFDRFRFGFSEAEGELREGQIEHPNPGHWPWGFLVEIANECYVGPRGGVLPLKKSPSRRRQRALGGARQEQMGATVWGSPGRGERGRPLGGQAGGG
jgi:hypothetical protein